MFISYVFGIRRENSQGEGFVIWWKHIVLKQGKLSEPLLELKKDLRFKEQKSLKKSHLSSMERNLIRKIQKETHLLNQNNVTRTKAYLDFYLRYPNIHWAFLGHMVSRNGGWNMTDLNGSILSKLLTNQERNTFFSFLERGNWLIFQDAYPQFLIYEESMKRGKNLFYLLPHLNVSIFMETVWNHFLKYKDPFVLTVSLIINEQNYLETRVIQNDSFKENVFNTLEFKMQDILSMNHILFPFQAGKKMRLIGQTLHHFESLHERILLGKRLYSILFKNHDQFDLVKEWALKNPHTGSRKDFWPDIFHDVIEYPSRLLIPRLQSCRILPGSSKIYSPKLEYAWKDITHENAETSDWYTDWKVLFYLKENEEEKIDGEIEDEYCKTLEKLELAAIAKKVISILD